MTMRQRHQARGDGALAMELIDCRFCGKQVRRHSPSHTACSAKKCQQARLREFTRKRWASDQEYRERTREWQRARSKFKAQIIDCKFCSKPFRPRNSLAITCAASECQRSRKNEWTRDRYGSDPEYRERRSERHREYKAAHPEYWEKHKELRRLRMTNPEYRARKNKVQREGKRAEYEADPEYHELKKALARARWAADLEYRQIQSEREFIRRRADPEYRAKKNGAAMARYYDNREQIMENRRLLHRRNKAILEFVEQLGIINPEDFK